MIIKPPIFSESRTLAGVQLDRVNGGATGNPGAGGATLQVWQDGR